MPVLQGMVYAADGEPAVGRVVRVYRRDTGALLGQTNTKDGSNEGADPHYSSVGLLLLCEGSNGATSLADSSPTPKTVSAGGNAHLTTARQKFGASCLQVDGAGDWVQATDASFAVGAGDFCIEAWAYLTRTSSAYDYLFHLANAVNDNSGIAVRWADGGFGNALQAAIDDTSRVIGPNRGAAANAWHHIAFTRQAGLCRLFYDGGLLGSASNRNGITGTTLRIGCSITGGNAFEGYIDSVRFTPGIARYTEAFTAPAQDFPTTETGAPTIPGKYSIDVSYTGEVQRIVLDDAGGDTFNDLIDRVVLA